MKGLDWLTIVLVALGALTLVASFFAKRRAGSPVYLPSYMGRSTSRHKPVMGALAFVVAALALQFFRGFDVPVRDVEFHSDGSGVVVTGTLQNPHSFKLNAIVVEVSSVAAEGVIVETETVVIREIMAGGSSRFSVQLKKNAPVVRVQVTAEGFWT